MCSLEQHPVCMYVHFSRFSLNEKYAPSTLQLNFVSIFHFRFPLTFILLFLLRWEVGSTAHSGSPGHYRLRRHVHDEDQHLGGHCSHGGHCDCSKQQPGCEWHMSPSRRLRPRWRCYGESTTCGSRAKLTHEHVNNIQAGHSSFTLTEVLIYTLRWMLCHA